MKDLTGTICVDNGVLCFYEYIRQIDSMPRLSKENRERERVREELAILDTMYFIE